MKEKLITTVKYTVYLRDHIQEKPNPAQLLQHLITIIKKLTHL